MMLGRRAWLATTGAFLAAGSRAGAQSATPLKVGVGMVEANAQGYYAADQGFYKAAGLDATVEQLRNGTAISAALVGGDIEVGVSNVVSLGAAHAHGIPFVIIAPGAYYDAKFPTVAAVVAADSPITSAKDLNGKTVGGLSVGGLDQLALWAYIDKAGGDLSTIKFVEVTNAIMAEALDDGRIAAASMGDPELTAAIAAGKVRILAPAWDAIAPLFLQTVWFTTRDWLAKNKDTARRFQRAIVNAGLWGEHHPELAAAILTKYIGSTEVRARTRYGDVLATKYIQPVYDSAAKYKLLPAVNAAEFTWDGT